MGENELGLPLDQALSEFLHHSFAVLEKQNVVPRPGHQPWMQAGEDCFGPDVFESTEFDQPDEVGRAIDALVSTYPERLGSPQNVEARIWPKSVLLSLIEVAAAFLAPRERSHGVSSS